MKKMYCSVLEENDKNSMQKSIRVVVPSDAREVYYHLEDMAENLGIPADNAVWEDLRCEDVKLLAFPFKENIEVFTLEEFVGADGIQKLFKSARLRGSISLIGEMNFFCSLATGTSKVTNWVLEQEGMVE